MDMVIYAIVFFIVITDAILAQYFNKKRQQLDTNAADYAQKDKAYRFIIKAVLGYSFVVALLLIVVVKPLFVQGAN